jgi:hypothetical protein
MEIERNHQISLCAALWLWTCSYSDCEIITNCRNPTIHYVTLGRIASWRTSAQRLNFISKFDFSHYANPTRFIQSHSFNSSWRVFFALSFYTLECPRIATHKQFFWPHLHWLTLVENNYFTKDYGCLRYHDVVFFRKARRFSGTLCLRLLGSKFK